MHFHNPLRSKVFEDKVGVEDSITLVKIKTEDYKKIKAKLDAREPISPEESPAIVEEVTTEVPKFQFGKGKLTRKLEVMVHSSQEDDESLLHKLLNKVRI